MRNFYSNIACGNSNIADNCNLSCIIKPCKPLQPHLNYENFNDIVEGRQMTVTINILKYWLTGHCVSLRGVTI